MFVYGLNVFHMIQDIEENMTGMTHVSWRLHVDIPQYQAVKWFYDTPVNMILSLYVTSKATTISWRNRSMFCLGITN